MLQRPHTPFVTLSSGDILPARLLWPAELCGVSGALAAPSHPCLCSDRSFSYPSPWPRIHSPFKAWFAWRPLHRVSSAWAAGRNPVFLEPLGASPISFVWEAGRARCLPWWPPAPNPLPSPLSTPWTYHNCGIHLTDDLLRPFWKILNPGSHLSKILTGVRVGLACVLYVTLLIPHTPCHPLVGHFLCLVLPHLIVKYRFCGISCSGRQ